MAQITHTVTEHINLGKFEWAEISVSVTADAGAHPDYQAWAESFQAITDTLLAPARERYQELTQERDSFIHDHPALLEND